MRISDWSSDVCSSDLCAKETFLRRNTNILTFVRIIDASGKTIVSYWNVMNKTAFSHRWVDVGGLSTRVVEAGEGDSTVVFLHGIGGHIETFCHNIAAHAQAGHRVLAIDLLGHGYTAKPDGNYEIEI